VFVTKYQYKVIKGKHIEYLRKVFTETMEGKGGTLEEFDGEGNYVHLLIFYPPRDMPDIKKRYWGKSALWSRSYFAGSVGGAPLSIVKQYIQQQDIPE
jgi:putative transposase